MPRFFTEEIFSQESVPKCIRLFGDDAFHLIKVLRAREGERVTVVSGDGKEYACSFLAAEGKNETLCAVLRVESVSASDRDKFVSVTLLQGMPKGKKTDLILQKATELGADRIALIYMDRSVPVRGEDEEKKLIRFRRIVKEAAEQCGRAKIPEVCLIPSLADAMPLLSGSAVAFACYEEEVQTALPTVLKQKGDSIAFVIGPEGGISRREMELLRAAGIPPVTLGSRILRTETAPLAVLSMILYEKELQK